MKSVTRLCLAVLVVALGASAQNTLNLFGDIGYGFGMGSYYLGTSNENQETNDHFLNLGHGAKLELGVGYMAAENLETRVSVDMSFGWPSPEIKTRSSSGVTQNDLTSDYSYFSWGIKTLIAPHFEALELLDVYVGVGLGLNFATSSFTNTLVSTQAQTTTTYEAVFKNVTPASLGFIGVAGFTLPMSDLLSAFGEVRFESMNFKLKETRMESNTSDLYAPGDTYYEEDVQDRDPPPNIPGNNWGIRAGLKLWLF